MKQLCITLLVLGLVLGGGILPNALAQKAKAKSPSAKQAEDSVIEIATGVPLILPQRWYNEIWAPFQSAKYVVTIRPQDGRPPFPGKFDKIEGPKDEKTGAGTYVFRINHTFDTPGDYLVEKVFDGQDELGGRIVKSQKWQVRVRHPRLAAPLVEDPFYCYGETPSIPFATIDYPDAQGYTWSVRSGGSMVDSGNGSTIYLAKLVNDSLNAMAEKEFEAKGYYLGRPFSYINPLNDSVRTTRWKFQVRRPKLDAIGILWTENAKTAVDDLPRLIMDMKGAYNPRRFSYVYLGPKHKSLIVTPARISNLRVTADPPDFLSGPPTLSTAGIWTDITITPSRAFLESLNGNPELVTLTISFSTQLEPEPLLRKYRALVY